MNPIATTMPPRCAAIAPGQRNERERPGARRFDGSRPHSHRLGPDVVFAFDTDTETDQHGGGISEQVQLGHIHGALTDFTVAHPSLPVSTVRITSGS